jgi:hypothetical protein
MCKAGGGDPDRLLYGAVRNVAGKLEWDQEIEVGGNPSKPARFYKFWRCFQTEARAAIAVLRPDDAK